jgi:hypothetical protein
LWLAARAIIACNVVMLLIPSVWAIRWVEPQPVTTMA